MSDTISNWRRIAGVFTDRVLAVGEDDWDNPTPCEGWIARDIVRHLVEWVPPFLRAGANIAIDDIPPVDDNPAAAWEHLDGQIQSILDDGAVSDRAFDHLALTGRQA